MSDNRWPLDVTCPMPSQSSGTTGETPKWQQDGFAGQRPDEPAPKKQRITETFGTCWQCHGSGQVQGMRAGVFRSCGYCQGTGQIVVARTTEDL